MPLNNQVELFLQDLKEKYKQYPDELERIEKIVVHPDFVEIGGLKLKRENEFLPEQEGVKVNNMISYFTREKAFELFGTRMPTGEQWQAILAAIPGRVDNTRQNNAFEILEMSRTGYFNPIKDKFKGVGNETDLWSCSKDDFGMAWCAYLTNHESNTCYNWNPRDFGFSVRLLYK